MKISGVFVLNFRKAHFRNVFGKYFEDVEHEEKDVANVFIAFDVALLLFVNRNKVQKYVSSWYFIEAFFSTEHSLTLIWVGFLGVPFCDRGRGQGFG